MIWGLRFLDIRWVSGRENGGMSYLDIRSSGAVASFGFTTTGGAGASGDAGALEAAFDFATTSSALIFRGVCTALPVFSDGILTLDCMYT